MTANQIAWAGLQETKRHDQGVEVETNRHNLADESLRSRALDIDAERNRITDSYNQRKADIDERYNNAFIKMQTALGEEKNRIQSEMNLITQERNANENEYHIRMNELQQTDLAIRQEAQDEVTRHNKEMEKLEGTYKFLSLALENKRAEYQNTYWRDTISLGWDQNSIRRRGQDFDFLLGQGNLNMHTEQGQSKMAYEWAKADYYRKLGFWTDWDHPLDVMSNALRLFK